MADGSSIGGGIAEGIKGIVGGTVSTAFKEVGEVTKAAVNQTTNGSLSPSNNAYKAQDELKIAQIKSKLHNEMIHAPSQTHEQKPSGPVAEQSFGSTQTTHMQQLASSKPESMNVAIQQAINPGERGKQNKG